MCMLWHRWSRRSVDEFCGRAEAECLSSAAAARLVWQMCQVQTHRESMNDHAVPENLSPTRKFKRFILYNQEYYNKEGQANLWLSMLYRTYMYTKFVFVIYTSIHVTLPSLVLKARHLSRWLWLLGWECPSRLGSGIVMEDNITCTCTFWIPVLVDCGMGF